MSITEVFLKEMKTAMEASNRGEGEVHMDLLRHSLAELKSRIEILEQEVEELRRR